MYILVIGNVIDGLNFVGPFKSMKDAIYYGENETADDWNVANLLKPEKKPK